MIGNSAHVDRLYNSFDIFALPSFFEGLGISAIEAQANGLPCCFSDKVPDEAVISTGSVKIPLKQEEWVNIIKDIEIRRYNNKKAIIENGYDIAIEAENLKNKYLYLTKNHLRQ